jgi:hypothetical protein
MPKTYNKYPYNISAAITPKLRTLLDEEIDTSLRPLSVIIREALYEYFDEEEDEITITLHVTPQEAQRLSQLGYARVASDNYSIKANL